MEGPQLPVVQLPEEITAQWVASEVLTHLDAASRAGPTHLKTVLPADVCTRLLDRCYQLLQTEPTLLEVEPPADGQVVVVGDTHGQFHDVCRMLELMGNPSASNLFVFNGDYVDRGAWGLETLVLLASWKLALPRSVSLLRGNHESATCTLSYGFQKEVVAKYGKSHWRPVYAACKKLFSALPLAARVAQQTLVLHGGLFRRPVPRVAASKNKRKRANPTLFGLEDVTLGSLDDLRRATKGGVDPNGCGAARLASDVLWSDPVAEPGFQPNDTRGVGMVFGPDVTERFLSENGLRLVLRSHEGPDAREGRDDMQPMTGGYTLDHDTPAGKLMTVFSAPDYPQFIPDEVDRYNNLAAVAVLTAPDWANPTMRQYAAAHPRPEAQPYYDLYTPDSDEEFELASPTASGMTGVTRDAESSLATAARPAVSTASDAGTGSAQQEQQEVKQQVQEVEQQVQQPQQQPQQQAQQQQQPQAAAQGPAAEGFATQPAFVLQAATTAETKLDSGRDADAAVTRSAAAAAGVIATADVAAQETSNESEETVVPETGAEGLSLHPVKHTRAAAGSLKDADTDCSPRKRSRRRGGSSGCAAHGAPEDSSGGLA